MRSTGNRRPQPARRGPRIDGCTAWIECDVESSLPAGDHLAIRGRVRRLSAADGDRRPLVFHQGRLVQLDRSRLGHAPTRRFDWWDA
ncbi:flavin reductase family protein [Kitasatospora sp. NBC_00315]|uniref:flavin reductase family protein n=1 Tax=Kitasatospora sp. NBC_00315 TaxID=2975963 RepID=UPI0032481080